MVTVWWPDGMQAEMSAEEFKEILGQKAAGKKKGRPRKHPGV